jgi:hypothetical protein
LITSFKVRSESKYTEPTTKVSAKTGTDVMNNAMNKDLGITNVAANDNLICLHLATDATIVRFTFIASSHIHLSKIAQTEKGEFGFSF